MSSDSCSVPPEFQAVILALDTDSPVPYATGTSSPKPLLPVMNQPLVLYQIRTLANHGFSSCIIVLCQSVFLSVSTILADRTYVDGFQVELVAVPDHTGTADALRIIRNKINTDFLVISGDLITDVQLHYLADFHRINDATVSVLMYKSPEASSSGDKGANVSGGKKKGKKKESTSSQVDPMKDSPFGGKDDLDRYHTSIIRKENALVYFKSSADIEYDGTLSLSKNLLRR